MRLLRAAWPAMGLPCALALFGAACGSTHGSSVNDTTGNGTGNDGSGATSSTGGTTGTTSGGPNLGNLGGAMNGDGTTDVGGAADTCAGTLIQAERIPLDMYVMLDVSGSMLSPTEGNANVTKWQAVSSALADFVNDPTSDGIGVGLQVFPIPNKDAPTSCTSDKQCGSYGPCDNRACMPFPAGGFQGCLTDNDCNYIGQTCIVFGLCANNDTLVCDPTQGTCGGKDGACVVPPSICLTSADCKPATYATAAAPIAALPGASAGLIKVIQASTPQAGAQTPTGPALAGAIQEAKAWATAHPDHQVVAVLATDGEPSLKANGNLCTPVATNADIQAVVDEAANGLATAPNVSTFVIGVLSPDDAASGAPTVLDAIANSGGSTMAFIVDTKGNVETQFRDALDQIRSKGLSCDLVVPTAEAGKTVDYTKVNVDFSGDPNLLNVPDLAHCDATKGGWYYDVPPAQGTPTRIMACPVTCDAFKATDMGSVKIELGCVTRSVVK